MKITRRKLQRIIKEERQMISFERNVRSSMVDALISEGLVPHYQISLLRESDADLDALEDSIMAQAKKAGRIGKIGIKALSAFLKPIAKQAIDVAKGVGKWGISNIGPAIASVGKFLGGSVGGTIGAVKDVIGGIKSEKEFRTLAEEKPDEFLSMYKGYVDKFDEIGLPVKSASDAAAFIGVTETDDGYEIMNAAAEKGDVSIDELTSQLNMFGHLLKYVDVAQAAKAKATASEEQPAANEGTMKITKQQLKRIVKEELARDSEGVIDHDSLTPQQLDLYETGYDDALEGAPAIAPKNREGHAVYMAGYEDGTHDRPATLEANPRFSALDSSGFRRPRSYKR